LSAGLRQKSSADFTETCCYGWILLSVGRIDYPFSDPVPIQITDHFLAERCYVTFGLWYELSDGVRLSVCRLSVWRLSVTLLHPRQRLELFGNIFAPPNTKSRRSPKPKMY